MADPGTDFEAVVAHELELLDPGVRGDPEAVRALLSEEFTEFGASGRAWDRDTITTAIGSEPSEPITAAALRPVRLGADAVLLTYTAHLGGRDDASQFGVGQRGRRLATAAPPGNPVPRADRGAGGAPGVNGAGVRPSELLGDR
ncbi:protein of unknown function [Actinopolyspora xinjiangensis]|uniref:DUF4440 domain-containing protein n=1 Tax=Actinopolyspora xinjiangensis TaxID=405564 RepID=A0A1H0WWX0_9ACTN|nr:nuclear transport factor 2 family protein [Actinopolyspora xinjiangensis]SDP95167.1 protein of unknown function [Actinopolyspora xinjiangensis]